MSQFEKDKQRLKTAPSDYTYTEAKRLLTQLGYKEYTKGKTSGSRVKFYRKSDGHMILLHKPQPGDIIGVAAVKDIIRTLQERGEL